MEDDRLPTSLLAEFAAGDRQALDRLIPYFYNELRKIAGGVLRHESAGHTLQPTALVHELYARMSNRQVPSFRDRAHFLGIAARAMRQILIDHARAKGAAKRGGEVQKLALDDSRDAALEQSVSILALEDALHALEQFDERKAQLIEMRYFGGLTAEESAESLQMPVQAVRRELRVAQAWLQREMNPQLAPV